MNVPWRDRRGRFLPLKATVLVSLFVPGALYAMWLAAGELGGRPVMEAIHATGLWAIRLLLISLAIYAARACARLAWSFAGPPQYRRRRGLLCGRSPVPIFR